MLAATGMGLGAAPAFAQSNYPAKPIHVIVAFGPGGLADVTMRTAGEEMSMELGQPVVIENHHGAGGVAAASDVMKSARAHQDSRT